MSGEGVVVHLIEQDPDRHRAVLVNVANLRRSLGHAVPVEIVAHGAGVALLTGESGLQASLTDVMQSGVSLLACNNTLVSRGLTPQDLVSGVEVVDSGVGHLARRQLQGWAYLRP